MKKILLLRNGLITILMAWVVLGSNVSAQTYPSGMVGYWKLDNSLIDELGMYNGTIGPYGSYVDGIVNQALHGVKACTNPYAAKVDNFPNLDSFTVEAWIKPACPPNSWQASITVSKFHEYNIPQPASVGFFLATQPSPYGSSNYIFHLELQNIINNSHITQAIRSPLTYSCDNWYHVVAIRDYGVELKLYVNGEAAAIPLADNIIGSIANPEPLSFHGRTSGGCGWGMSAVTMDEVAIYNRVLSEAEIQQHYQNGLQGLGYEIVIIPVSFDIKPESCPNPLNKKSKGVTPMAILGTADFDVTEIDVATLRINGVSPVNSAIEDVATPYDEEFGDPVSKDECTIEAGDGYMDLTLKFKTQDILTDVEPGVQIMEITGTKLDGTSIKGQDVVWIK